MKKSRSFFLAVFILFLASGVSALEDAVPKEPVASKEAAASEDSSVLLKSGLSQLSVEEIFNQRLSLDLRNIDILEALKFLSTKTGLNIISTKNVSGRVTLTIENATVKDVFDIMLRSNGLSYARQGNIFNVMSDMEYKALYGGNFFDSRQVKVFRLSYTIPDQAFSMLDALKSDIGRVLVDPESGNVLILDTPERILRMQQAMEGIEKQNSVVVFPLKYAKAKDIEEILKVQLDAKKVGSIKADERNNQVIVQTLPERMLEIERIIKSLDKVTKQVLIDTQIIKIKLSNQQDSGVEWEGIFNIAKNSGMNYLGSYPFSAVQTSSAAWRSREQVLSDLGGSVGSYPFSGTTSNFSSSLPVAPGEKLHFGIIKSKTDFDVMLKYLQTIGRTQVLSSPKLVVVNNQEAKIHVGERQAYVTTTTTTGQTTNTIAEEVTFVDVGIQLAVTATINDDGFIILKVKPEISSVTSILTTPTNNKIPIIDTSLTETTVLIKDGTTLIIGGLRKDEKTNSSSGFPMLGKIPFLGNLFKSATTTTDRTELMVMLTPHIITGDELTTGDPRGFGTQPGKDYRAYQSPVAPLYQEEPVEAGKKEGIQRELPVESVPKSYRDMPNEFENEKFLIKESRYEP